MSSPQRKSKRSTQLIIKQHQPAKTWFLMIAYGGVAFGIGWFLYSFGLVQAGYSNVDLGKEISVLTEYRDELKSNNDRLKEQIAMLARSRQVESGAYAEIDTRLQELQSEILELKQEVAFYRGIVSSRESAGGLNVQSFFIENTQQEGVYQFKLVLTQVMKNQRIIRGKIKLAFEGVNDGKLQKISIKQASGGAKLNLALKFKYFQTIAGNVVFPDGFLPTRVFLDVIPVGKKQTRIEKIYDWTEILK